MKLLVNFYITFSILELFDLEAAAIQLIADIIITKECLISVDDMIKEEVRSAMLAYADYNCKCADKVTALKEELRKCHKTMQELSAKLKLQLPPFCDSVSFYTGLPNVKVLKAIFFLIVFALPSERSAQCKLPKFQEFIVVMFKLRINPP